MAILDLIYYNPIRLKIAEFLQMQLFVGFDVWMIVHLLTGFLIMFFLVKIFKNKNKNLLLIFTILILSMWEFYELFNFLNTNRFFVAETITNQLFDLMVGFIGAIICMISCK